MGFDVSSTTHALLEVSSGSEVLSVRLPVGSDLVSVEGGGPRERHGRRVRPGPVEVRQPSAVERASGGARDIIEGPVRGNEVEAHETVLNIVLSSQTKDQSGLARM